MAQQTLDLSYYSSSLIYNTGSNAIPAGIFTPLLQWQVPLQVGWYIPQNPKLLMNIVNSTPATLPPNTQFILAYQRPSDSLPQSLGPAITYAVYASLYAQYNGVNIIGVEASANYDSVVRLPLYAAKSFVQNTIISLLINVPTSFTVNWANSSVIIRSILQVDATTSATS